jgi:hypothetical protein
MTGRCVLAIALTLLLACGKDRQDPGSAGAAPPSSTPEEAFASMAAAVAAGDIDRLWALYSDDLRAKVGPMLKADLGESSDAELAAMGLTRQDIDTLGPREVLTKIAASKRDELAGKPPLALIRIDRDTDRRAVAYYTDRGAECRIDLVLADAGWRLGSSGACKKVER